MAGDANVSVSGKGRKHEPSSTGITHYHGFKGTVKISGSNVIVKLAGANIKLTATGTGKVSLRGKGTYTVNGRTGDWSGKTQVDIVP